MKGLPHAKDPDASLGASLTVIVDGGKGQD